MRVRSLFAGTLVVAVVIAIAIASFLGYRVYAKKTASSAVVALAAGVTTKLNGAIEQAVKDLTRQVSEALRGGAITAAETRRYGGLLEQTNQQLAALEAHRKLAKPELFEATLDYITDGALLLRRIHMHARLRGEVFVELGALDDLRRQAGTRSGKWISEMVATKKKLDQTAFEYRNAVAALDSALTAMTQSRRKLAKHVEPAVLVIEESLTEFQGKLTDSMVKLTNVIEDTATLGGRR